MTSAFEGSLAGDAWLEYGFAPPYGMFLKADAVDRASYTLTLDGEKGNGKIMKVKWPSKARGANGPRAYLGKALPAPTLAAAGPSRLDPLPNSIPRD